ncbi:MAG TPA: DUF1707 and DUF4190 domain-containing protein [Pseudonocardiaceae bacterium]|jgi:hypothetical protein|nr:DUF1707 and DUF4190 domain-containing protein [Pseudonocardiaceae bacterium]
MDETARASDADRQSVADRLRAAFDEGRLPMAEYNDRLQRAYLADTHGELAHLCADLPKPPRAMPAFQPLAAPPSTSGLAVAALVLGILALLGFWIPFLDLALGVTAVVLAWFGVRQARRPDRKGTGLAIGGLVTGLFSLLPSMFVVFVTVALLRVF